jgi:hypothetical protein
MPFEEIIPVYSENRTNPIHIQNTELLIVKPGGAYRY